MLRLLIVRTGVLLLILGLMTGCGGGGGGDGGGNVAPNPPPVANASPGGLWEGVDSDGGEVIALVTETGRFHFVFLASDDVKSTISICFELTIATSLPSPLSEAAWLLEFS